ncbi:hybrid sensor histidine kinase/response regulator [Clostridium vincentii]|uniref:Stage 0 sporulation protein A homolog n=1 Tax=Clostridium vincentii TaxID=52704 RepID=A0A2T0BA52_9CLOT|nr:hybrid sensor histidine kinase/response regulator [Clostridium vincentii]PRR80781.1 Sensor protein ZraS [Clostridium vincentii]
MNILIVDDSKFNLISAQDVIKSYEINCVTTLAYSGEEAIKIINSQKIDIVLLDIVMPNLSGIETLEIIRRDNKNIIILMFTSLTDKKYLEKSFELGANDYINKPIEPIEFISRLKSGIKMKEYQNALIESYNSLKSMNSELKASNAKLQEVQIELINKEKLSTIGRFSAGIAHEINTPLGYITSNFYTINKYSNILKENLEKSTMFIKNHEEIISDKTGLEKVYNDRNKLDFIFNDFDSIMLETNEGLAKISKIIKDLIRFSNEYPYSDLQLNKFSEIVQKAISVLNSELKGKKLEDLVNLNIKFEEEEYVKCNGFEIVQVILNILMNAIYFISKKNKKGNIYIKTYILNGYFCCDIEDTGIGIKPDIINKIFEPFFTTKEPGEGMGLGLTICYNIIVDKHKGLISAKSTYGDGSVFSIKLPI